MTTGRNSFLQKAQLLHQITESRNAIAELLENLSNEKLDEIADQQTGWSIKTLVAHLTFWEFATLDCRCGRATTESLKDIPAINAELLTQTRSLSAEEVLHKFHHFEEKLIIEISNLTEGELLAPAPWPDRKPLWEHLLDDTVVHYEEHKIKLIQWCAG